MKQHTLAESGSLSGPTVYSDAVATVTLHPAEVDYGIEFWSNGRTIPARAEYIHPGIVKWTTLRKAEVSIHCVEHLMSALYGMGIQNVLIEVRGAGIPILDGSAAPFVELIEDLGIEEQEGPVYDYRIVPHYVSETMIDYRTGEDRKAQSFIMAYPCDELRVSYSLDYPETPLKSQLVSYVVTPEIYAATICEARTFMTKWEIERWHGWLLSPHFCGNVLIVSNTKSFVERISHEAATHKVLDFIGDLALWMGNPQLSIKGAFSLFRSGHSLNKKLIGGTIWSSSS